MQTTCCIFYGTNWSPLPTAGSGVPGVTPTGDAPTTSESLWESIPRLLNEGTTAMTARCALACSQALPVKPQGVWARIFKSVSAVMWPPKLELRRWRSSGHSSLKPRLHYTRRGMTGRDAIWRDIQVLFTLCATSSRAVTWQQGIWDPEQIKLGNLNGCFDPTWHCVYLTDIPPKITSIRITQPHKHITWNTNSSHWWVLIKVCWGVNPGCVNSTSHVTLNQAS